MLCLLLIGLGADPTFTVENRCPPALTVVNRCPAPVAAKTGYPVRGNWWTHPGEIHAHLMSGEHRGKWTAEWVRSLTNAEAESLHSDDHEGRVKWDYVGGRASTRTASPSPPLSKPVAAPAFNPYTLGVDPNCPTGQH